MNKKMLLTMGVLGAFTVTGYQKQRNNEDYQNDNTPAQLVDIEKVMGGFNSKTTLFCYLLDTDNDKSTVEYVAVPTGDQISATVAGEAYNDKQSKPTRTLAQWNKNFTLYKVNTRE